MERKDISKLFARVSKKTKPLTEEERIEDGIKTFKRKAMGFFRSTVIKTSDEIAELLYGAGITSSIEDGKELIPELVKYNDFGGLYGISFKEARSKYGESRYEINAGWYGRL
ncbi:MAG: hypothetical protein Q8Q04_02145 [archaeon]|nr:hypothetical protein [archaeon]